MTDPAPTSAPPVPDSWESHLPTWQQSLNRFCENWIFAFIVAMAIRHFCLEAFRIPSASMEPMLYGDPAFMKGDYVVVDKIYCRFTGVKRWDVTVFQFPLPEIEAPGVDARPAIDAYGRRLDIPMLRPLMYRNFVKRAVIMPGDTFFIRGGDIYLKQGDSWQAARKPESIQEQLWQEVYRHGDQAGYLPWKSAGASTVAAEGSQVVFGLTEGSPVLFDQPFWCLYLKPNRFLVRPAGSGGDQNEIIELAMTKPVFTHRKSGREGNAWKLEEWDINRLTSADLDSGSHGTHLNPIMNEWVGDVRIQGKVASLEGEVAIELHQGSEHRYRLVLRPSGWVVEGDGKELATGNDVPVGGEVSFAHLDNQIIAVLSGKEVVRHEVPAVDPMHRITVRVAGQGKLALAGLHLQRDQHYTMRGFLTDQTDSHAMLSFEKAASIDRMSAEHEQYVRRTGQEPSRDPTAIDTKVRYLDLISNVRAQMIGLPESQLSKAQKTKPVGTGPETAITAPAGAYLMLGDNSPHSWDAREWGWVPVENIRGRALAVVMPASRWRVVR